MQEADIDHLFQHCTVVQKYWTWLPSVINLNYGSLSVSRISFYNAEDLIYPRGQRNFGQHHYMLFSPLVGKEPEGVSRQVGQKSFYGTPSSDC